MLNRMLAVLAPSFYESEGFLARNTQSYVFIGDRDRPKPGRFSGVRAAQRAAAKKRKQRRARRHA
jgi:hypothetical protein